MVKVGKEFGGDIDPDDPDIKFRKERWDYWEALRDIRAEYLASLGHTDNQYVAVLTNNPYMFSDYIESKYGIRMGFVNGNITDRYDIVDEQKYLIFLLKWK
jgi:hypothetical protein